MIGKGIPVLGKRDMDTYIFMIDCTAIWAIIPPASKTENLSEALADILNPRRTKVDNMANNMIQPTKPSSSA